MNKFMPPKTSDIGRNQLALPLSIDALDFAEVAAVGLPVPTDVPVDVVVETVAFVTCKHIRFERPPK
jgi:hypothetical protein